MGIAGRVAKAFLHSKLTPLVVLASLAVGGIALIATPREEEPQISVPMIDVTAALPGARPAEVEQLVTRPIEKLMWEVPGVEYVYATAGRGWTLRDGALQGRGGPGEERERGAGEAQLRGRPRPSGRCSRRW